MFLWPAGFAAAAINLAMLPREGWPDWMRAVDVPLGAGGGRLRHRLRGRGVSLLRRRALEFDRPDRSDRRRGRLSSRSRRAREAQLQKTGATWIATTDYRTYAMLRWHFNDRVPVIQINERGRFQGFRDPGMDRDQGSPRPLCRARAGRSPCRCGDLTTAKRAAARRGSSAVWRGMVMDTYALEKLTGWTPELSPPPDRRCFAGACWRACRTCSYRG